MAHKTYHKLQGNRLSNPLALRAQLWREFQCDVDLCFRSCRILLQPNREESTHTHSHTHTHTHTHIYIYIYVQAAFSKQSMREWESSTCKEKRNRVQRPTGQSGLAHNQSTTHATVQTSTE
jgi:hypothetical protein